MILFIYRFIIGVLPMECFEVFVERGINARRRFKQSAPEAAKKLRRNSFFYRGPQIYNLPPEELRQVEVIDHPDKSHDTKFLDTIPDEPTTPDLVRGAATNSLIHQIDVARRRGAYGAA